MSDLYLIKYFPISIEKEWGLRDKGERGRLFVMNINEKKDHHFLGRHVCLFSIIDLRDHRGPRPPGFDITEFDDHRNLRTQYCNKHVLLLTHTHLHSHVCLKHCMHCLRNSKLHNSETLEPLT